MLWLTSVCFQARENFDWVCVDRDKNEQEVEVQWVEGPFGDAGYGGGLLVDSEFEFLLVFE